MGKLYAALCAATFLLVSLPAICGLDDVPAATSRSVPGEKLDSGLGSLPPYSQWANYPTLQALMRPARVNRVPGEKLDSGLGEMHAAASLR